ncbi:unannotated protein [freshwater metagenome]|uniref:Unannotated protein n=1 Tax=freshwater metagenome TaxID=449393 RepID=A0A6J6KBK4_9ZZZZ
MTERTNTTGTKMRLIRSASCCAGAFSDCAAKTILVIRASSVSDPILVALTKIFPLLLIEPAKTKSLIATSMGLASPVKNALLIVVNPDTTWPSVAIRSPGFTTKISPT